MSNKCSIAIIGAGAWGTTLAILLSCKGLVVKLWTRNEEFKQELIEYRENRKYLSGITIPSKGITISTDLEEVIKNCEIVVVAVPSPFFRKIVREINPFAHNNKIFISVTKGFDEITLCTMSQVLKEELPDKCKDNIGVISGPNLAREIAKELPAVTVASSQNLRVIRKIKQIFQTKYFRVLQNSDVKGVEIAGALKNIFAIAAGIADTLGFGSNTFAAILTGGLTEIYSLGVRMGARFETFLSPAGIGDLFTTCTSSLSRNKTLGIQLAKGRSLNEILTNMNAVVEGVNTTRIAYELSHEYKIDMPITREVYRVLTGKIEPFKAVQSLMTKGYAETVYNIPRIDFISEVNKIKK
ncbi:MAG TPA: NAD(P)H-dependent glycerol-3-phosphate dehydrogenase [Candidatus Eremiobacteraeota bacterium]|nr:MAG: Glycerol-3-phosphate dehydrogenase (NAD(P)+) [bacterium ADurb.Bin363]HPZ06550.1 NAD(P)H-dependent glycerol-3-phosphate dehydrogenase [Candidatus Eremiobacteraeota bacterium]